MIPRQSDAKSQAPGVHKKANKFKHSINEIANAFSVKEIMKCGCWGKRYEYYWVRLRMLHGKRVWERVSDGSCMEFFLFLSCSLYYFSL